MKYVIFICVNILLFKQSAFCQTAYNNYINTEESKIEGILDIAVLGNGDWLATYNNNLDSTGLAYFDRYGHLKWTSNVSSLDNVYNYAESVTIINDTTFAMLEFLVNPEIIFPEYDNWMTLTNTHLFNSKGEVIKSFFPTSSSLSAYMYNYIVSDNNEFYLLGYGGQPDVSGLYNITLLKTDLEGNTLNEFIIEDTMYLNYGEELSIIDDKIIFGKLDYNEQLEFESYTIYCLNKDFETIWAKKIDRQIWHFNVSKMQDGNFLFAANTIEQICTGNGEAVRTLLILDSETGDILEEETYSDYYTYCDGYNYCMVEQEDGSILSGGYVYRGKSWENNDTLSAYVMKIDTNYNIVWEKYYNCIDTQWEEYIRSVEPTPDGGLLLAGWTRGIPPENDEAMWALKVDSLGNEYLPLNTFFENDTIELDLYESITLNPIPYGGSNTYTHQWSGDIQYLDDLSIWYPTFTASEVGVFTLNYQVTDTNEEMANADIFVKVNDIDSSNNSIAESNFKVYPNPAKDILNVEVIDNKIAQISIIDLQGRSLYNSEVVTKNSRINISKLYPNRIYYYEIITSANKIHKGKFLKIK